MARSKEMQACLDCYIYIFDLETMKNWAKRLEKLMKDENHPLYQIVQEKICEVIAMCEDDERNGKDYSAQGAAYDLIKDLVIIYRI